MRELTLVTVTPGAPASVEGAPGRLAQMIGPPLHDARRFTERSGPVEVRVGHSDGPGQGALFTFRIPSGEAPPGASARDAGGPATGGGLRVLIIEDNQDAAETLGELLELSGHEVKLALDGAAGVAAAREACPHVVISDLGLPGELDGYAVARALRAEPSLQGAYLIALSGYASDDARQRSREAGFDMHLAKPPDIAKLEKILADLGRR